MAALNEALDAAGESETLLGDLHRELFRDLLVHPKLVWYLNQIVGHGFRLDRAPRLLGDREGEVSTILGGGDEPRNPSHAYFPTKRSEKFPRHEGDLGIGRCRTGRRWIGCCSGKSQEQCSNTTRLGNRRDDMGWWLQPALKAGDLFLVAASTLQGVRPWKGEPKRLLTYQYAGRAIIQSNPLDLAQKPNLYPDGRREQRLSRRRSCIPWV